ncbi:MAG: hypothetical protein JSS27_20455, partial [Planctomycetes bacterium]|nr:hypothetical protein [Planctomycetota bacterium]
MCDFHSICVRADGAIAHHPSNSHSRAVAHAGWKENTAETTRFWECEWGGEGEMPDSLVQARNGIKPPEEVIRIATAHYAALYRALHGGDIAQVFLHPDFYDVRYAVA